MTRSILSCLLILGLVISGCSLTDSAEQPEEAQVFEVHLQTWFDNTPVRLNVDGHSILTDTVSTGDILAYAAIVPVEVTNGEHSVTLVAGEAEADTAVRVRDTLYVGVNYDAQREQISFRAQRKPFPYR